MCVYISYTAEKQKGDYFTKARSVHKNRDAKATNVLTEETFPWDELLSSNKGVCLRDL